MANDGRSNDAKATLSHIGRPSSVHIVRHTRFSSDGAVVVHHLTSTSLAGRGTRSPTTEAKLTSTNTAVTLNGGVNIVERTTDEFDNALFVIDQVLG